MRLPTSRSAVFILALLAGAACTASPDSEHPAVRGPLDEVFRTDAVITLGEDPQDSIATPGIFKERAGGGFLLSDGQLPKIRSYHEDGGLNAAFGRFGEGPFEFQRINGLAETASGEVAVLDSRSNRLTYLTAGLRPDTVVRMPGIPRNIASLGEDLLLFMPVREQPEGVSRFFERPLLLQRWTADGSAWSAYRLPYLPIERPYWNSFRGFSFAVAGDSIYAAFSFRYPVAILNAAGDSVGEIGVPSATFDPIPVFEPGAFNPGAYPTQTRELLGGRSTIARIAVVGPRLVVVHGRYGSTSPGGRFGSYQASLDIYDRHTGRKLYEDVPLPENSRVLGGGRHLYLLLDTRFPPWHIAKLGFLEGNRG